jgi:Fic family protein
MNAPDHVHQLEAWQEELRELRPLSPAALRRLQAVLRTDEMQAIYQSNAIEGNTLTLRETELVVAHGITIGGKPLKDHLEAINLAAALEYVRILVTDRLPLANDVLLRLHHMVLTRIDDANAGRFRRDPVRITGAMHIPPSPARVPELMDQLWQRYEATRDTTHPVLVAAELHERIAGIHPFIDGNGRTARLAMNIHLMQRGYPLVSIAPEHASRLAYYAALDAAHTGQDPEAFRVYIMERVRDTLGHYLRILREETDDAEGVVQKHR